MNLKSKVLMLSFLFSASASAQFVVPPHPVASGTVADDDHTALELGDYKSLQIAGLDAEKKLKDPRTDATDKPALEKKVAAGKDASSKITKADAASHLYFPLLNDDAADTHFGQSHLGLINGLEVGGALERPNLATDLLNFRPLAAARLTFGAAITQARSSDGTTPSTNTNVENFVQNGGNAYFALEVPLLVYYRSTGNFSISFMPRAGLDLAFLGGSSTAESRNGQLGLRLYANKTAFLDPNIDTFIESWAGSVWGTNRFYDSLGQAGRNVAMYGRASAGIRVADQYQVGFSWVYMAPAEMRGKFLFNIAILLGNKNAAKAPADKPSPATGQEKPNS